MPPSPPPPRVRRPRARQPLRDKLLFVGLILSVVGAAASMVYAIQAARAPEPRPENDRSGEVDDLANWRMLVPVGEEGWVGELPDLWSGHADEADLKALCEDTFSRLGGRKGQTLTLVGAEGEALLECGPPTAPDGGPHR